MSATDGHFKSNNHALATGILLGHLIKAGIDARPVLADNEQDYTAAMVIYIEELEATIAIEVVPPEADAL